MASLRYTLLFITVLLFSWPVLVAAALPPWLVWLYPFTLWFAVIAIALITEFKSHNPRKK